MIRALRQTTTDEWLHLLPSVGVLVWAWGQAVWLNTRGLL